MKLTYINSCLIIQEFFIDFSFIYSNIREDKIEETLYFVDTHIYKSMIFNYWKWGYVYEFDTKTKNRVTWF